LLYQLFKYQCITRDAYQALSQAARTPFSINAKGMMLTQKGAASSIWSLTTELMAAFAF
jgi:hypothetical protein